MQPDVRQREILQMKDSFRQGTLTSLCWAPARPSQMPGFEYSHEA